MKNIKVGDVWKGYSYRRGDDDSLGRPKPRYFCILNIYNNGIIRVMEASLSTKPQYIVKFINPFNLQSTSFDIHNTFLIQQYQLTKYIFSLKDTSEMEKEFKKIAQKSWRKFKKTNERIQFLNRTQSENWEKYSKNEKLEMQNNDQYTLKELQASLRGCLIQKQIILNNRVKDKYIQYIDVFIQPTNKFQDSLNQQTKTDEEIIVKMPKK